jgi:DNA-binding NarL/FixJ family response regulator
VGAGLELRGHRDRRFDRDLERHARARERRRRGRNRKDSSASAIARAIETVHAGEALFEPSVQPRLAEGLSSPAVSARPVYPDALTQREVVVLRLIARGQGNQEIAASLFISEATVKTHINNIFGKAQLRDRSQGGVRVPAWAG